METWGSDGTFPESYQYPCAPLWELRGLGTTHFSAASFIKSPSFALWASLVAQRLKKKKSAHNGGDSCSIPGLGRSPEKKMATHSRILAWKIPLTEELGRLQSMGSQRGGHG